MAPVVVLAMYRFVTLDNPETLRQPLLNLMQSHGIRGTVLLATEGINGTVAGSRAAIDALLDWLSGTTRDWRASFARSPTPMKCRSCAVRSN